MQDLNWNDLGYLLALARAGDSLHAARTLKVDETTVVRRLARIEQSLDARLFERTRGRCASTPAGATVVARAERVDLEVDTLRSQVTGVNHTASGLVRICRAAVARSLAAGASGPLWIGPHHRGQRVDRRRLCIAAARVDPSSFSKQALAWHAMCSA